MRATKKRIDERKEILKEILSTTKQKVCKDCGYYSTPSGIIDVTPAKIIYVCQVCQKRTETTID